MLHFIIKGDNLNYIAPSSMQPLRGSRLLGLRFPRVSLRSTLGFVMKSLRDFDAEWAVLPAIFIYDLIQTISLIPKGLHIRAQGTVFQVPCVNEKKEKSTLKGFHSGCSCEIKLVFRNPFIGSACHSWPGIC